MLFKNKICEKCGYSYDETRCDCPCCKTNNEDFDKLGIPKTIFWLNPILQGVIFVLGFAFGGFYGLQFLFAVILGNAINDIDTLSFVVTAITYVVLFGAMIPILLTNKKPLLQFLKDWKGYVIGIGFAVILFLASQLVGIITENLGATINGNQNDVEKYLKAFTFPAFIVMGIIGPIVEECTYRIGLFSFFRRLNRFVAYLVSMIVFGLIHMRFNNGDIANELLNLPNYLVAGLVLSIAYDTYGPVCSMVAHILYNLFSLAFILIR